MTIHIISQNPYRILGVLSNSPLKERVGNQNRLAAFAKVGKEVAFPNDFATILTEKPVRTLESVAAANTAITLDIDQLKYALFWFISGSTMDDIALRHLQTGNREKAEEIFQKKETYSSLINSGVLAFIDGNITAGFNSISKVVHNPTYRAELLQALSIPNLQLSEDNLAELVIEELLKEIPASKLLSACTNPTDCAIVSKSALEEPISAIDSAIAVARNTDSKNPEASLAAGTKLMNSTKASLKTVKEIAGAMSQQYQMVADNVAKQVLQCGINYYNNAPDSDTESPHKAMELQSYALSIAVGQLTKDRCQENYNILKERIDKLPPKELSSEYEKILFALDQLEKYEDFRAAFSNTHSLPSLYNTPKIPVYAKASPHVINHTIRECAIRMGIVRDAIGCEHPFYVHVGNLIIQHILPILINYVNFYLSQNTDNLSEVQQLLMMANFKGDMESCYSTILDIGIFPCDIQTREWYDENHLKLRNMLVRIIDLRESSSASIFSEKELYDMCRTVSDYKEYIKYYPNGKHASDAKSMISCFNKIESFRTLEECIAYNGSISNKNLVRALDHKAFCLCETFFDYKKYCSYFSYSKSNAQKRMNEIKERKLKKIVGIILTVVICLSVIVFWSYLPIWVIILLAFGDIIYWGNMAE